MSTDIEDTVESVTDQSSVLVSNDLEHKRHDSRRFPLSSAQCRLWLLDQIGLGSSAYNQIVALRLVGELSIDALEQSIQAVIVRHEVFRTTFDEKDGEPYQTIGAPWRLRIPVDDISGIDAARRDAEADLILGAEAYRPFDLKAGALVRARLIKLNDDEHIFAFVTHHICFDGWSRGVLIHDLSEAYKAALRARPSSAQPLKSRYSDFALWERDWLSGDEFERQLARWRQRLLGLENPVLPMDRSRPATRSFRGAEIQRTLMADLGESLKLFSQRRGVTAFMTLLTAFVVLLHRYCGQDDIVVGSPMSNRNRTELEALVGFFVNMLVLRTDVSGDPSFQMLLDRVREVTLTAYSDGEVPFEKLVEEIESERDLSRNPLVQVTFAMRTPSGEMQFEGLNATPVPLEARACRFDLECYVSSEPDGLMVRMIYDTDLFDTSTIQRMLMHYERILEAVVADPGVRVGDIELLSAEERAQQLECWAGSRAPYPRDASLAGLFAAQAAEAPGAPALAFGSRRLSYAELDCASEVLARRLVDAGAGVGATVGVLLERGVEMVVAWLGVLKAGGAYLPLDPEYPTARLDFILRDAGVRVVVSDARMALRQAQGVVDVVDITSLDLSEVGEPVRVTVGALDPAYVVYTSGSTGEPKGVVVPQRGVVRLVSGSNYLQLGPEDRVAQCSNVSFDAATFEVWGSLLNGGCLVGMSRELLLDAERSAAYLQAEEVTVLFMTTALFNEFSHAAQGAFAGMRAVLFGGELVNVGAVHRVLAAGGPERLLHVYGPTESTTFASWYEIDEVAADAVTVPIGHALSNTQLYVLGERRELLPVGVVGELYIGGDGLALGYLNQPELSSKKFVTSPFAAEERLYRTGDRVRWHADGSLEFLGRIDGQVKLRGYRIELGEVEHALLVQAGVREAVAMVREDLPGDRRLVGYVVGEPGVEVQVEALRAGLRGLLPEYMVPSAVLVMPGSLPLTANGKVDRNALPKSEGERPGRQTFVAPRNVLEQQIAGIWREVLGAERVGTNDNFFDLGGHSLLLLRVRSMLEAKVNVRIPAVSLFQYPDIDSLARHLSGQVPDEPLLEEARRWETRRRAGSKSNSIAIIGMAGRFPGAPDLERFWSNLRDGVESIRFFSEAELIAAGVDKRLLNDPNFVPARGTLDDAELFDASFFGYTPKEAELMDPQQRIFLECAWEALENAGYDSSRYSGYIGVYAGSSRSIHLSHLYGSSKPVTGLSSVIAHERDFLPTRVSYKLDLHGPSVNVQTACSTSLVAVHQACRALLDHDCDMALAGAAALSAFRAGGYLHRQSDISSPDGHCRAFDADATGTVGGEGVGLVVLKRLEEAIADGDVIHAVIRGTAVNNDGAGKVGYTAPSVEWQARAIAFAHAVADVDPASISYVESHGTGTTLGDPIEIAALTRAFEPGSARLRSCAIGALKPNIGHLDAAAGIAGLIKTVLALKNRELPPTVHFKTPNPEIDFESGNFFVNAQLRPWESRDGERRCAGVSAFGIGGTNAHAVVEEAPQPRRSTGSRDCELLVLSAKTASALEVMKQHLAEYLDAHPDLPLCDVAYTLQVGRREFGHRCAVVCRSIGEGVSALRAGAVMTGNIAEQAPGVVFVFPGQGAQYVGMGGELYRQQVVFRDAVDKCCDRLERILGLDLRTILYPEDEQVQANADRLNQTALTQPALFVVEYALAQLWMAWGIRPVALIGHGIGEYVAACISEVFSLDDALSLVAEDAALESFRSLIESVDLSPPTIPYLSNVTGDWIRPEQATDPAYYSQDMDNDERFREGLETLIANGPDVLLEIGPRGVLSDPANRLHRFADGVSVITSLGDRTEEHGDIQATQEALGHLWVKGLRPGWQAMCADDGRRRVELPTYPFERQRYRCQPAHNGEHCGESSNYQYRQPVQPGESVNTHNDTESIIVEILQELLGFEPIDHEDDFFDLGMHSLLAIDFSVQLRDSFRKELPVSAIFEAPTARALAAVLDSSECEDEAPDLNALVAEIENLTPEAVQAELNEAEGQVNHATHLGEEKCDERSFCSIGSFSESPVSSPLRSKQMKFSLFFFSADGSATTPDKYRLLMDCARFGDQHDFSAVWTPERHFENFGGLYPNPSVLSAALSEATERIQIRAGSVVAPLHHPIRIAEEWALVDNLSNGRVGLALGCGWHPRDFVLSAVSHDVRKQYMFDQIQTLRDLWAGKAVNFHDPDGREHTLSIRPRPLQETIPLWISIARNPETWVQAAAANTSVLTTLGYAGFDNLEANIRAYRAALEHHGHDPAERTITVMVHTFLGENDEKVKELVREPLTRYLRGFLEQTRLGIETGFFTADAQQCQEVDEQSLLDGAFSRYFDKMSLLGTPDKCSVLIERLISIGVNEVACLVDFGLSRETTLEGLQNLNDLRVAYEV